MLDLNLYSKCCFLSSFLEELSLLRGYEVEQGNSFTCKAIRFCRFAIVIKILCQFSLAR